MPLARFSLRRPVALTMVLAIVVLLGSAALLKLPLAFLPTVDFPFIGVVIPYAGGVPEEVEREIVRPIEEVLATLGGVQEIRSQSQPDQAFVGVRFDWGRDVDMLRLEVQEKIDRIRGELPPDVRRILLLTFDSSDIPIVEGRIAARGRDLSASWDLLDQKIIAPLQRIPGVGRVNIDGVQPTQASVYLDLDRLLAHGVDAGALFDRLASANAELTVGRVTERGLRYDVRAVSGLRGAEALAELPIGDGLRLRDVAEVDYGAPPLEYGRRLNGEPAVAFWIQKASGFNTVEVCRAIEARLAEINLDPTLQGISSFTFFNQADQITDSLRGLLQAGLFGSLLAVGILYVFLRRLSLTLVVALAIPLSILGTMLFLYAGGHSLNVLTMMGLMLGVGMLVDNAVVVLESIHRRQAEGRRPAAAALRGTREVGRAITASTLTTVIVFAPIVVSKSDELAVWLGEVGLTISATLVISLLVSLSFIPALSVRLSRPGGSGSEAGWLAGLRRRYLATLGWTALRHPVLTGLVLVPAVLAVTGLAMGLTGFKPQDFGEEGLRRERLYLDLDFDGPVDLDGADRAARVVEAHLESRREELGLRDVYSYFSPDGAGVTLFFRRGVLSDSFYREVRSDLRESLPVQAGLQYRFGDEEGHGSGEKTFSLTVWGERTELLRDYAEEARRRLAALPQVADLRSSADDGRHEVQVRIDRERASRHGVRAADAARVVGLAYRGIHLPRLDTGEREIDLVVSLRPEDRRSLENMAMLTVGERGGRPVRIGQIADLALAAGPRRIERTDRRTGVTIRGTCADGDLDEVLGEVRRVMDGMALPVGYGWGMGSEIQRARQQQSELGLDMLLALACVFFVMAALFESLLHPLVVMGCVPFASLGVFWIMMATGTPFNLMAMIGMVILIGIVVNNGIVLVDQVNNRRRGGMGLDEALLAGCSDRLRPILMTAGTTILGLLPLAVIRGAHLGDAEYYPMARAICGGLASSTLLTLLVLPTYYRLSVRWAAAFGRSLRAALAPDGRVARAAPR